MRKSGIASRAASSTDSEGTPQPLGARTAGRGCRQHGQQARGEQRLPRGGPPLQLPLEAVALQAGRGGGGGGGGGATNNAVLGCRGVVGSHARARRDTEDAALQRSSTAKVGCVSRGAWVDPPTYLEVGHHQGHDGHRGAVFGHHGGGGACVGEGRSGIQSSGSVQCSAGGRRGRADAQQRLCKQLRDPISVRSTSTTNHCTLYAANAAAAVAAAVAAAHSSSGSSGGPHRCA